MGKYITKPAAIEATKVADALAASKGNWDALPTWLAAAWEKGWINFKPGAIIVSVPEKGGFSARGDDWLIYNSSSGDISRKSAEAFAIEYEMSTA